MMLISVNAMVTETMSYFSSVWTVLLSVTDAIFVTLWRPPARALVLHPDVIRLFPDPVSPFH